MYELKKLYLIFFFGVLAFSASTSAQNYGGELDGDWASIEEEKEFRLGFFADNSRASVAPQSDGSIKVANTESGDSIQVEPGEIGDASEIFGSSTSNNYFANCGYVQRSGESFVGEKVNFYYGEDGGGAYTHDPREKLGNCLQYRTSIIEKVISSKQGSIFLTESDYQISYPRAGETSINIQEIGSTSSYMNLNLGNQIFRMETGEKTRLVDEIFIEMSPIYYSQARYSIDQKIQKINVEKVQNYQFDSWKKDFRTKFYQLAVSIHGRSSEERFVRPPQKISTPSEDYFVGIDKEEIQLTLNGENIEQLSTLSCNSGREVLKRFDGKSLVLIRGDCGSGTIQIANPFMVAIVPENREDEALLPDAEIEFDSGPLEVGEDAEIQVSIGQEGDYTLELTGAGIDKERKISSSKEIKIEPSEAGTVNAKLRIDSDNWLLVDNSDLVSETSVKVAENLPEASISYDLPSTTAGLVEGQETKVKFNFKEPGEYKISSELNGNKLASKEIKAEVGETYTEDISVDKSGTISSKVVAPSGFWIFGSDKTISSNNLEVKSADNVINAETGEIHNISIYEGNNLVNYDGRTFRAHNRYRVASDDNPPTGVRFVWNNGETTLLKPNEQRSGIHLCEFGGLSEGDYALIVTGDVENPTAVCRQESDNLEVDRSAEFGEIVSLEQNQIADFEGIEVTLHSIYEYGISMSGRSYTLHELESHSSTDNYIVTCQTRPEKSTAELTMVQERTNPYNICNVDVKKERNATPEYDMKEYQLGEKIELSEGEGLKFGESTAYIDEIDEIESDFIRVQGYKERTDKPTKDLYTAQENSSTVEWFAEGEMLIGTCELTQEKVEIIIEERNQVSETAEWPEDWCHGESPDANEGSNNQGTNEGNNSRDDRKVDLNISKEEYETGDTVNVEVSVTESIAENGYSLSFVGPSEYSEDFDSVQGAASFTPEEQGDYTVKIIPREGLISRIGSSLVGNQEESLKTVKFTVINPKSPKWISYCQEQKYDTDSVSQKVTCIEKEIVPQYFQETTGEKPEIAQSLCNNLLGYNYNQENNRCAES